MKPTIVTMKKAALVLPVAAGLGVWTLSSEADPQDPWADLAEGCATFEGARIAFSYDDNRLGATRAFILNAKEGGRIGVDEFNGYRTRYAWSLGEPFTKHWRDQPSPRVILNVAPYIEDIWDECRQGFSSSIWHHEMPPPVEMAGYSKLWGWARLELPFAWADGLPLWVAADMGTGAIARLVFDTPNEPFVVTVAEVAWNAEIDAEQVSALSPAMGPTRPPFFRNGRNPEDIQPDPEGPPAGDFSPPTWSPTVAKPGCLSQPNGGLVKLDLYEEIVPEVWDPAGASVQIVQVTSTSPDSGTGPGDLPNDVRFNGKTTCVRAENTSIASPRVYTITLVAKDAYGNTSTTAVNVTVPGGQTVCPPQEFTTVPDTDPSCQL